MTLGRSEADRWPPYPNSRAQAPLERLASASNSGHSPRLEINDEQGKITATLPSRSGYSLDAIDISFLPYAQPLQKGNLYAAPIDAIGTIIFSNTVPSYFYSMDVDEQYVNEQKRNYYLHPNNSSPVDTSYRIFPGDPARSYYSVDQRMLAGAELGPNTPGESEPLLRIWCTRVDRYSRPFLVFEAAADNIFVYPPNKPREQFSGPLL